MGEPGDAGRPVDAGRVRLAPTGLPLPSGSGASAERKHPAEVWIGTGKDQRGSVGSTSRLWVALMTPAAEV
jgi:hypothetical protein